MRPLEVTETKSIKTMGKPIEKLETIVEKRVPEIIPESGEHDKSISEVSETDMEVSQITKESYEVPPKISKNVSLNMSSKKVVLTVSIEKLRTIWKRSQGKVGKDRRERHQETSCSVKYNKTPLPKNVID